MSLRSIVVVAALALSIVGAVAAAPPTPAPVSVLAGQVSVSATSTSSRVALPSSTVTAYAITLRNTGTKDIHFRQGSVTVVALTTDPVIVGGDSVTIWVSGTYVAAITSGSDTGTLLVYQSNGPLALRSTPSAGGGGGSGTVTEVDTGTGLSGGPITTSGTVALKPAAAGEIGGVNSSAAVTHNFLTAISTAGVISKAQPACADISDAGTGCSGAASATGANPSATIGATAVNGSAVTFMRSDAAPPLPATLPAINGSLLTNLNGTNVASGTVADARLSTNVPLKNASNVFTSMQVFNLNTAGAPTPVTGTVVQIVGADAANGFVENDTFGATPIFTGRRADGTGVSPTAVQSTEALAGFSARPYDGTGYTSASTGNVQAVASENFSGTNHGTDLVGNCTAITTTMTAECWRAKSSGFTIPTGSTYQINGTQIAASSLSNGVTGSGAIVLGSGNPTITLANGTGLPISTGVSGLGTGVATLLGAASSGTGALVATSNATLTNATVNSSLTATLVRGGILTSSILTLESTSAAGTTDSIVLKTGSQVTALTIDTNQKSTFSGPLQISASNAFIMGKATDPGTAPGAAFCKEYWVAGTNSGTGKKIAYCGTSTTPVTLVDNVGGGF